MGLEKYYFRGYWNAAELLIEATTKDPLVFFPAAHNYRQYIELHLKYLLGCLRDLNIVAVKRRQLLGHDLRKLWKSAKKGLLTKWPDGENHPKLERAQSIILEFHRIDPTGEQTRYPTLLNGEVSFANLPGELNFAGTREKMKELYDVLDGCTLVFAEQLMAISASQFGDDHEDLDATA